jgi:hypothetical protein
METVNQIIVALKELSATTLALGIVIAALVVVWKALCIVADKLKK